MRCFALTSIKEGAMDYSDRAHRLPDDEADEFVPGDPLRFVRGLMIAAVLSLLFWAAVVVFFVLF